MDIGKEEEAITYEPIEDPFNPPAPAPEPERTEAPERDRVEETEREKVPA